MKICERCNSSFKKRTGKYRESNKKYEKRRFCSIKCRLEWQKEWYIKDNPIKYFDNSGNKNPRWGKFKNNLEGKERKDGYKRVSYNGKRILKHRFLKELELGRKLMEKEIVHHRDGNNKNNELDNLIIITQSEHCKLHNFGKEGVCR